MRTAVRTNTMKISRQYGYKRGGISGLLYGSTFFRRDMRLSGRRQPAAASWHGSGNRCFGNLVPETCANPPPLLGGPIRPRPFQGGRRGSTMNQRSAFIRGYLRSSAFSDERGVAAARKVGKTNCLHAQSERDFVLQESRILVLGTAKMNQASGGEPALTSPTAPACGTWRNRACRGSGSRGRLA